MKTILIFVLSLSSSIFANELSNCGRQAVIDFGDHLYEILDSENCSGEEKDKMKFVKNLDFRGKPVHETLNYVCGNVRDEGGQNQRSCNENDYGDGNVVLALWDNPEHTNARNEGNRKRDLVTSYCSSQFHGLMNAVFNQEGVRFGRPASDGFTNLIGSCMRLKPNWQQHIDQQMSEERQRIQDSLHENYYVGVDSGVVTNDPDNPLARECVSLSTTVLHPQGASCGRTAACIHTAYCPGRQVTAQVICDANGNSCPDIKTCIAAPSPSWIDGTKENMKLNVDNIIRNSGSLRE